MPTYSYKCEAGHAKEVFHSIMESPELYCDCGNVLRKTYDSSPVVSFKGEGFYSNDKKK